MPDTEKLVVYTYSEARQKLAALLDMAKKNGKVLLKRKDGQVFTIKPAVENKSPLDIKGINTNVSAKEKAFLRRNNITWEASEISGYSKKAFAEILINKGAAPIRYMNMDIMKEIKNA